MRPRELFTLLRSAVPAHLPILITGAPGIGKTDIITQVAQSLDADLIVSHPAVADPTDAKGLPWIDSDGKQATFLPFGETARAMKANKLTIWFLDDFGQAPPAVQASYMQLLLARQLNGFKLSDHITFIVATNRRTDRAGVSGILEPVKSRFASIVELQANLDDWCAWAIATNQPPEFIAFLRFRPELLSKFEPTADLTNSPSPRTWSNAARIFQLRLPRLLQHEAITGSVGAGPATELQTFLQIYETLPVIDDIIANPDGAPVPKAPNTLFAVVTALASRVSIAKGAANVAQICRYAERLVETGHAEFAALLMKDSIAREPGVLQSKSLVRLLSGELGALVSGGGVK